jgi:hypothetical protein
MAEASNTHGETRNAYKILFGSPRRRWEDNIKWIFGKSVRRCGLDLAGSAQRLVAGSCEHDNEPSGSMKGGDFLDYLRNYQHLKKDSAPWS